LNIQLPVPAAWSTACPDWQDRIRARRSLVPDLPLDTARSERALTIFKTLRIPDVIGRPTFGDVAGDWTFDLVRAVFGAFDVETQRRMIREYFVLIAKKNTKTTVAAGILVTASLMNEVPAHTFALIAPTINIANHAFSQAAGMIRHTVLPSGTRLEDLFAVRAHKREIELLDDELPSTIAIKAADTDTVTGFKNGSCLIDELHELASKTNAAGLLVEIRGAMSSPDNKGFLLTITTQSKDRPRGVMKDELSVARAVRDGALDLPLLPVLYELPSADADDDGWKNRDLWALVNPNLGRSVDMQFLEDQLRQAEAKGPEAVQLFASQHLNVEVGLSLHADLWAGATYWQAAAEPALSFDALLDRCEVCVAGIDGGGLDDLVALAVIGREKGSRRWLHWAHAWAQPDVFERRKQIVPQLRDFESDGDLTLCETTDRDAQDIAAICARIADAGLFPEQNAVGLDAYGVATIVDALAEVGLTDPQVVAVGQGYKLQSAVNTLPRKLKDRTMRHCNQPLMAWAVGNAKTEVRGSNVLVTKQAAGSAKIDPLMATFNAAMLMFANPVAATGLVISIPEGYEVA